MQQLVDSLAAVDLSVDITAFSSGQAEEGNLMKINKTLA